MENRTLPLTVRRAIELTGLYFLVLTIIAGKEVIIPLVMAFLLSMMLLPLHRFLSKKLPETLSIFISLLLLFVIVGLLAAFFSMQISYLVEDFPQIKKNLAAHLNSLSQWINDKTGFSAEKQTNLIRKQNDKLLNYAGNLVSGAASSASSVLVNVVLLPVYIFLILYYKNLLLRFVFLWFPADTQGKLEEVMRETEVIIKSYLVGLLIQITYITVLLGGILLLFGIKSAILIGAIFAVLNLIPYVGALIGNIIGVLLTISSTQEVTPIFIVLLTIAFVQFLDNNILMPRIVGSKVKINALVTIVGVVVAGAIAGISGMFLSLPVIAVLKIIFDRTQNLKQWGVLLGDDRPDSSPFSRRATARLSNRKGNQKSTEENDAENKTE